MKRKARSRKRSRSVAKTFATLEQFTSYFFPKGLAETRQRDGKDSGARVAGREFVKACDTVKP